MDLVGDDRPQASVIVGLGDVSPAVVQVWEEDEKARALIDGIPTYIRKCGRWTIATWNQSTGDVRILPYRCRSWRCPRCVGYVNWRDRNRIAKAIEKHGGVEVFVYMVLTFGRGGRVRRGVRAWRTAKKAYAGCYECWDHLRKRMGRRYGTTAADDSPRKLRYVAAVEAHGDGFPHLNVLMHQPDLASRCREEWKGVKKELRPHVLNSGFGNRFWIEGARGAANEPASYLVKQAVAGTSLGAEMAKELQLPLQAPKGFRRLRASRGFLPPPPSGEEAWTGVLVKQEADRVQSQLDLQGPGFLFEKHDGVSVELAEELERGRQRWRSRALQHTSVLSPPVPSPWRGTGGERMRPPSQPRRASSRPLGPLGGPTSRRDVGGDRPLFLDRNKAPHPSTCPRESAPSRGRRRRAP